MSNILEISGVNLSFGGLKALDDVNLTVKAGTVHAIIGPNGAGKSTLLNGIIGKLAIDSGSIAFNGKSMLGVQPHEINQLGISRVFQTPEIYGDLTLGLNPEVHSSNINNIFFLEHSFLIFFKKSTLASRFLETSILTIPILLCFKIFINSL